LRHPGGIRSRLLPSRARRPRYARSSVLVTMELSRVLILDSSPEQFITLTERDPAGAAPRSFAIKIGTAEAMAIERRLQGHEPPRPQTHDLLDNVIRLLGGELVKVVIHRLDQGTYFASLLIRQGMDVVDVDARPSDAIALSVAHRIPIEVAEEVLEESAEERPDVEPPIETGEDDDDD
jgi:bifunctional DNase/RNase